MQIILIIKYKHEVGVSSVIACCTNTQVKEPQKLLKFLMKYRAASYCSDSTSVIEVRSERSMNTA